MSKKIVEYIKKNIYFIIPIFVSFVSVVFRLIETVIDDTDFMHSAESISYNTHSEFFILPSVILGYILKPFYKLVPFVNWLTIIYLLTITFVFVVLHYLIHIGVNYPVASIILVFSQLTVFCIFTFTTISFICLFTGLLCFLDSFEIIDGDKAIIRGFLFTILGFIFRNGDTLYFVLLVTIPICFVYFAKNKANALSLVLVLSLIVSSSVIIGTIQEQYVNQIPENMYYQEFNEYRSAAIDYGKIDYDSNKTEFDKSGITKNDVELFNKWVFADKSVFSADKIKTMANTKTFLKKSIFNPGVLIKDLFSDLRQMLFVFLLILFAIVSFVLSKEFRFEILLTVGTILSGFTYLHFINRGIFRVCIIVLLIGIIIICFYFSNETTSLKEAVLSKFKKNLKRFIPILCSILLILSVAYNQQYLYSVRKQNYTNNVKNVTDYITVNNTNNYIIISDIGGRIELNEFNKNYFINNRMKSNSTILGGWDIYSYYWYAEMERLGYKKYENNAIYGVLLDDNTKLITSFDPKLFVTYYKEHYNVNVDYTIVNNFENSDIAVYDFYLN